MSHYPNDIPWWVAAKLLPTLQINAINLRAADLVPNFQFNAINLSQGEHIGSPLQSQNTSLFVGADLCVCP